MTTSILEIVPGLKQKSRTEYAGPCPWCGGKDRFVVWPAQGSGGRFYCRRCLNSGDIIDLLRHRGLSFSDAQSAAETTYLPSRSYLKKPSDALINTETWQQAANAFVTQCSKMVCKQYQDLLNSRGINNETAARFRLGWNPTDSLVSGSSWGITNAQLRIPAGLVIPNSRNDQIISVKIRCSDPKAQVRYWKIRGSQSSCLRIPKTELPTIIVESELDAILIDQEAGDIVSAVALGGTSQRIDDTTKDYLRGAPRILIATDFDKIKEDGDLGAGQKAYENLKGEFPHAEYLPPAIGKDPTEMHKAGITILNWINYAGII